MLNEKTYTEKMKGAVHEARDTARASVRADFLAQFNDLANAKIETYAGWFTFTIDLRLNNDYKRYKWMLSQLGRFQAAEAITADKVKDLIVRRYWAESLTPEFFDMIGGDRELLQLIIDEGIDWDQIAELWRQYWQDLIAEGG
jgi:hypothetical protein